MCSQIEAATLELWSTEMGRTTFEKYYRVQDLAGLWGLSPKTVSGDARLLNFHRTTIQDFQMAVT